MYLKNIYFYLGLTTWLKKNTLLWNPICNIYSWDKRTCETSSKVEYLISTVSVSYVVGYGRLLPASHVKLDGNRFNRLPYISSRTHRFRYFLNLILKLHLFDFTDVGEFRERQKCKCVKRSRSKRPWNPISTKNHKIIGVFVTSYTQRFHHFSRCGT